MFLERIRENSVTAYHYDGLLGEEDLLRKDNIWFIEKIKKKIRGLLSEATFDIQFLFVPELVQ